LQLYVGIVQREKLVDAVALIEKLDPSTRDCDILLRPLSGQYL
jgi:hypothetical protein